MHVVEELVEGIPWYAKYALIIGGALMSAFASTFPESVQTLGRDLGVGLALLGCVAVVWHWANVWREKHGKPRLKLEPIHLIILGLVIALGGVVWQWSRPTPIDPQVGALQTEIANLRDSLAAAHQAKPIAPVQAQPIVTPPKPRVYSDKADAKEALENLHDVLVKKVQPALTVFPKIDASNMQRNVQSSVSSRLSLAMNRPDQPQKLDPKEVRTGIIKGFLENQLSALTDQNTKLGEAQKTILDIRAKQKAITAGKTEEFFALAYPPQTFNDANSSLIMALRFLMKQDTLDTDFVDAIKANYVLFEVERTKFATQITDGIHRVAEEISAIDD